MKYKKSTKGKSAAFEEKRNNIGKIPFIKYIAYALLFAFFLTGVSFSSYSSNSGINSSARVASFSVSVWHDIWSAGEFNDVSAHEPDGSKTYTFTVTNTGEVAVKAKLVVEAHELEVTVNSSGWFNLSAGASQSITLTAKGISDGHDIKFYFEYEQTS